MFKQWKEARENKRLLLQYSTFLLGELSGLILDYKKSQEAVTKSGITEEDALNIMNKVKGLDQKEILNTLVNTVKSKEGK